ncbi:MAG: LPXTG cell wall anchor domain-containing protein, partial [Clostridiales bacterium]|nr:LPXTG cell wall anchor domain-containing protein [Clostridiales bacterium]
TTPIVGAIVTVDDKNYITDANGEISLDGLAKGEHSYKITGYNVDKVPTVVKDEGTFVIDGVNSPSLDYRDSSYSEVASKNNNIIVKDIQKDLNTTLSYIEKNQKDMWAFLSLNKFGKEVNNTLIEEAAAELKSYGIEEYTNTDIEKLIITLTAAGYSPYNFAGYNLVDELYNKRNLDKFLINDAIFGLIALDYTNDKSIYKITREKLVDYILKNSVTVNKNGKELYGWTLSSQMGINPDITGIALVALSPYMNDAKVKEAVNKAVDSLSKMQLESGYIPDNFGTFSETLSFVILGLTAVGENPEGVKFTKTNGDLYSALLSFRVQDGQFAHELGKKADYMATEQALRALIAISEFKKSGKYNFFENKVELSALKVYEVKESTQEETKTQKLLPKTGSAMDITFIVAMALAMIILGIVFIKKENQA